MPSDGKKSKKGQLKNLDSSLKDNGFGYNWTEYIKRFFYQIIGIYFPASLLFLYLYLFWYIGPMQDPISYYLFPFKSNQTWPDSLIKNASALSNIDISKAVGGVQTILFVIAVVILGEGINALTAWLAKLSPVATSKWKSIKFRFNSRTFPAVSNQASWPIWLNATSFPVSFAQFDRYYLSALEQDKRTLAGKIGWVSFYRNLVAVFSVILIMQFALIFVEQTLATGKILFVYDIIPKAKSAQKAYPTPIHGYEVYVIVASALAIILLFFGYTAQVQSNQRTFWDAYRRYELRKNLEIRHGDITLSFGIKEEYKTRALEYIVDRWFLAVENTIQTISRYLLTKLEQEYSKLEGSSKQAKKIRNSLSDSYSDWNRGSYERVIANTLSSLRQIKRSPTEDDWKLILGVFILENSLRTDAAFVEISKNIEKWDWIIKKDNKSIKDNKESRNEDTTDAREVKNVISSESIEEQNTRYYYSVNKTMEKEEYDDIANLLRETTDSYQLAFFEIMATLRSLNSLLKKKSDDANPQEEDGLLNKPEEKEWFFEKLKHIYKQFGSYKYDEVHKSLKHFFDDKSTSS